MSPPTVADLVTRAVERTEERLAALAPSLADPVGAWVHGLWRTGHATDYFLQPDRFPFLHLPEWLEATFEGDPDEELRVALVHSSVNGYWFVRLLDTMMDEPAPVEPPLPPALAFFHAEFEAPYRALFAEGHPFWDAFHAHWYGAADAVAREALGHVVGRASFDAVSAGKMAAAKIPLAAVCHRRRAVHRLAPWAEVCDGLARFEQLYDDLLDWNHDLERGASTWVLAEARRRARPGESVAAWMEREGFEWWVDVLEGRLAGLEKTAAALESPGLADHVGRRRDALLHRRHELLEGLRSIRALARAIADH